MVPEDTALHQKILKFTHNHHMVGHPGTKKTLLLTAKNYWWLRMADFIKQYIKGCRVCQATKLTLAHPKPLLYPIVIESSALPFSTIALDLIVDLSPSQGYDSILTIIDHNVTKAALFFPCHQTITGEGVVAIYAQHVFPHYGLPCKVIFNQDTRFTSRFIKKLERILDIAPNMSTTYHPQMDGQLERTNQWLENAKETPVEAHKGHIKKQAQEYMLWDPLLDHQGHNVHPTGIPSTCCTS